ncbi:MAG: DUF3293 domain-containing protein [Myxococcota bacterium]
MPGEAAFMDQNLLRSYFSTVYDFSTRTGNVRASLDGEASIEPTELPDLLQTTFSILTAYNPRSMLLPRRVNEGRHLVLRDLLIIGSYRVDPCVGFEADKRDSPWREPSWLVHSMDRDEAVAFGRVFRQNTVIYSTGGQPEVIITDPTADDVGRAHATSWRVRS